MARRAANYLRRKFGKRLRKLRIEKVWTQVMLADYAVIGVKHIADLERGRKEACLGTLQALADAFDMSLSELLHKI